MINSIEWRVWGWMEGFWSDTKDARRRCIRSRDPFEILLSKTMMDPAGQNGFDDGLDLRIVVKCWSCPAPSALLTISYQNTHPYPLLKDKHGKNCKRYVLKVTWWLSDGDLMTWRYRCWLTVSHCPSHWSPLWPSVPQVCPTQPPPLMPRDNPIHTNGMPSPAYTGPYSRRYIIVWQKPWTTPLPAIRRDPNTSVILSSSAYPDFQATSRHIQLAVSYAICCLQLLENPLQINMLKPCRLGMVMGSHPSLSNRSLSPARQPHPQLLS